MVSPSNHDKLMLRQTQHEGKKEVLTLSPSKGEPVEALTVF